MKRLYLSISLIGVNAICSQIILIREIIAVFSGNELTMGFVLASWFFWVALGSTIGGRWRGRDEIVLRNRFALLQTALPFVLILQVVAIRWSRIILRLPPLATVGMAPIFWVSFLFLAPLCLMLGIMFSLGYQWFNLPHLSPARRVGWVYVLEAIGAGAGGVLFSFLLIRIMSHFQICLLLGLVNLLAATLVFLMAPGQNRGGAFAAGALCLLILAVFFASPVLRLDFLIYSMQWKGFDLLACRDSIFGRIALTRMGGEYSFYEHGVLTSTIPNAWSEEWTVHLPLVQHPEPKTALLIGTGIGSLREAVKHQSLVLINYIELDPTALTLASRYCPREYTNLLTHPKVHPIHTDGRLFLKESPCTYDVVMLGLPDPKTAQLNRMYTAEFFDLVSRTLSPDGVVAFAVTSSENYIGPQLGDFLRCIHKTLGTVFPAVLVTPGDTAYFLAGKRQGALSLDPDLILQRLSARGIETQFFSEWYIPSLFSEERTQAIHDVVSDTAQVRINTDLRPICYFYDLILWGRYFSPLTGGLLEKAEKTDGRLLVLLLMIGAVMLAVLIRISERERGKRLTVGTVVLLGGFVEIVLEFLLILGFQVFYGYAYLQLGIIITAFMVGLTIGSALMTRIMDRLQRAYAWYCGIQIAYILYPLFTIFIFSSITTVAMAPWPVIVVEFLFTLLAFMAGFLGGFQFPLATRLFLSSTQQWKGQAGLLYGLDLIGSACGAILASSFLVPLFGIVATLGVLSLTGGIGLSLLLVNRY
ncbi:MAG: hypothetical protein ACMUIL_01455 [bacterium]